MNLMNDLFKLFLGKISAETRKKFGSINYFGFFFVGLFLFWVSKNILSINLLLILEKIYIENKLKPYTWTNWYITFKKYIFYILNIFLSFKDFLRHLLTVNLAYGIWGSKIIIFYIKKFFKIKFKKCKF